MIKFKNKEQAIEIAIQMFDKNGHVEFDGVGDISTENVKDVMEESSLNRVMYELIEQANHFELYEVYNEAYLKAKIAVVTNEVEKWWAAQ
jgi:hypothetical protein